MRKCWWNQAKWMDQLCDYNKWCNPLIACYCWIFCEFSSSPSSSSSNWKTICDFVFCLFAFYFGSRHRARISYGMRHQFEIHAFWHLLFLSMHHDLVCCFFFGANSLSSCIVETKGIERRNLCLIGLEKVRKCDIQFKGIGFFFSSKRKKKSIAYVVLIYRTVQNIRSFHIEWRIHNFGSIWTLGLDRHIGIARTIW